MENVAKKTPEDYVIATGKQYSVKQFINLSLKSLGIKFYWKGKGVNSRCYDLNGNCIIESNKRYYRPLDVQSLIGDARKAKKELNWSPKKNIYQLIKEMIKAEEKKLI